MSETSKRRRRGRPRETYPSLLKWREALDLNQRVAATVLGITQSKYSRLERGVARPVGKEAKHIMARTGVPLEVLVGVA